MENKHIGEILKQINDKLKVAAENTLKDIDLTIAQTRVLQFVQEQGGKVTQKEIEKFLNVSHPTVVGIVTRLEKNGFLACYKDDLNKRNKIVCTTKRADEIKGKMFENMNEAEMNLIRSLSKEEVEELRRMLYIIYKNVEELD